MDMSELWKWNTMEEGPDCFTRLLFLQYNNRATFTRSFEKCAENNALAFKVAYYSFIRVQEVYTTNVQI